MEKKRRRKTIYLPRKLFALSVMIATAFLSLGIFSLPASASVTAAGTYKFSSEGIPGTLTISVGNAMNLNLPGIFDCGGSWTSSVKNIAFEIPKSCQHTGAYIFVGTLDRKGIENGTFDGPFGEGTWSAVREP